MEEHFVNYNQALALKELGFNEPCMSSRDMNNGEGLIQIPLKSQVFKWFRDKYNIHSEITWSPSYEYDSGEWSNPIYEITFVDVSYTKEWKAESPDMQRSNGKQLTYKEAESACIDKLIEIIKEKKS